MAARILGISVARQFCRAREHIFLTQKLPVRLVEPVYCKRLFHVKLFDKDAGLEAQRQTNKYTKIEQSPPFTPEVPNFDEDTPHIRPKRKDWKRAKEQFHDGKAEKLETISTDPDTFGNGPGNEEAFEDDDDEEEAHFNRSFKKLRTIEYARLIKDHLKAKQLKAAINVLEQRILKEDHAKPDAYIYNLLISGCAKAGYTRKAFQLFTKMRQRGLQPKGGTYTSLFNACANAPSAADGLGRAQYLREVMLEKGYEPNVVNYNVMIKAYGRWGDVQTAYQLADEMMERQLPVNTESFNFLLQACASDTKLGFRHCLLTWHKMMQRKCQPDYYTFNTVLRCTRDCGFGDLASMYEMLQQLLKERQEVLLSPGVETTPTAQHLADASETHTTVAAGQPCPLPVPAQTNSVVETLQVSNEATQLEIPNLLAPQPHLGSLISLAEVTQAHDRFLLLGGLNGFLDLMKQWKITPDIETFTMMLEVIPPTNVAEKQVIMFIRKIGLKSDIDFFNVLIKKRSMRFDYEGAKEVLSMIRTARLQPDIVTYGVLALGCQTVDDARELLEQMHNQGVRMNIQILGAMLRQGCAKKAFLYIREIMQVSLDENIRPNDVFLRHLHNFHTQCARAIDARHPSTKTKVFQKAHGKFCDKLRLYYEEQGIAGLKLEDAIKKINEHPYDHYKEASIDGIEPLKNEKLARKHKLRKYIKKIKIDSLRGDDDAGVSSREGEVAAQRKLNPFTSTKQLD